MLGGWQSRPVDATITASTVHNAGIADIASIAVLYDSGIQGCFLPSFGHDLETECTLASSSLVPSRRCKPTLWEPKSETTRAAEFTARIKKQIIRAIMEGCCPIVVSMGVNAMTHNWARVSLFHREFEATYGPLNMWLHISAEEDSGSRQETSRVLCPEAIDGVFIWDLHVDGYHRIRRREDTSRRSRSLEVTISSLNDTVPEVASRSTFV
jgi:hypothetical protein